MFRIGDFSKLSRVSIKTLRYYDELGLLRPSEVDHFTGYRYYTAGQLPRLNRILVYKELGFSLEQITQLLDENLPPPQIRGMLRLKQAEVQQLIASEQSRLALLEARLNQIEQEDTVPAYEVVLKKVELVKVAGLHEVIPDWTQSSATFNRLFTEVIGYIYQQGGKPKGPEAGIALFHDPEYRDQHISVEAAVAISEPLSGNNRIIVYDLPLVETMACVIYPGSFSQIGHGYKAIMDWIAANNYRITGPSREVYLGFAREGDPSGNITEIQFPVEKV